MKKRFRVILSLVVLMSMTSIQTTQTVQAGEAFYAPTATIAPEKAIVELPDTKPPAATEAPPTPVESEVFLPTLPAPTERVSLPLDMETMPDCAKTGTSIYLDENFSIQDGKVILFDTSGDAYYTTPVSKLQFEDYCLGQVILWAGPNIDFLSYFEGEGESCGYIASNDKDYLWDLPEDIFIVYATKSQAGLERFDDYTLWFMVYDIEGQINCGFDLFKGIDTGR